MNGGLTTEGSIIDDGEYILFHRKFYIPIYEYVHDFVFRAIQEMIIHVVAGLRWSWGRFEGSLILHTI